MRRLLYIVCMGMVMALVAACDTETYSNGDMDGFWHIKSIENLAEDGSSEGVNDVSSEKRFWSIQGKLIEVNNIFFLHERKGDSLILHQPYLHNWHVDSLLTDVSSLSAWGISDTLERYAILELNSSDMTLRNKKVVIQMEKY
ncbi:MAG: lipocalin-like domain-containing protein [Prevotella sp.]|jgi:hypothetical protein